MDQNTTRIFIADDHPLVRGALRQAVSGAVAQAEIVECGDLDALSAELEKNSDADFGASGFIPKTTDIEAMRAAIRAVLAGETWTPSDVDLGAPADKETADTVRRLASLTPQQVRVLMMLSEGLLNKQIAYELSVSEATVKAHVSAILQKLGVESRTQAVIAASKIEAGQWQSTADA